MRMKLMKRYSNGRGKSFTMTAKVEIKPKEISYHTTLFCPDCKDGGEEKIVENLVEKGWIEFEKVPINRIPRTVIGKRDISLRELIDTMLYIDAYWETCNFWTRRDQEQDIPFSVKFFLFLVEKLTLVLGDNILSLRTDDMVEAVSCLHDNGFKESNSQVQW